MKAYRAMVLALAAVLTVSLAACGKDPDVSTDPVSGQTTASSESLLTTPETTGDETGTQPSSDESAAGTTTGSAAGKPNTTTTTKSKTTQKTTAGGLSPNVTVPQGAKRITDGLNFGGATFKFGMTGAGNTFDGEVRAFQQKFNCKLEVTNLAWDNYGQKLLAAMTAGEPYDITFMHTLMFPSQIIQNIVTPVQDTFTEADLWDPENPEEGGISLPIAQALSWNGNLYVMYGGNSLGAEIMYYNKKLFRDAGLEDPYELYQQGKWTWDKIKEMGADVTDSSAGIYFFGGEMRDYPHYVTLANGGEFLTVKDGVIKENLTDKKLANGLQLFQELCYGPEAIVSTKGGFGNTDQFISGNTYTMLQESFGWETLSELVKNSNAFDKNVDNLGYVPLPYGPDNTEKVYPVHAYQGFCAGNGTKDKRAAVAFAIFDSTYRDPTKDTQPAEFISMRNAVLGGNIAAPYTGFSSSSNNSDGIAIGIGKKVAAGENIAQVLSAYRQPLQDCIDTSIGK